MRIAVAMNLFHGVDATHNRSVESGVTGAACNDEEDEVELRAQR